MERFGKSVCKDTAIGFEGPAALVPVLRLGENPQRFPALIEGQVAEKCGGTGVPVDEGAVAVEGDGGIVFVKNSR